MGLLVGRSKVESVGRLMRKGVGKDRGKEVDSMVPAEEHTISYAPESSMSKADLSSALNCSLDRSFFIFSPSLALVPAVVGVGFG